MHRRSLDCLCQHFAWCLHISCHTFSWPYRNADSLGHDGFRCGWLQPYQKRNPLLFSKPQTWFPDSTRFFQGSILYESYWYHRPYELQRCFRWVHSHALSGQLPTDNNCSLNRMWSILLTLPYWHRYWCEQATSDISLHCECFTARQYPTPSGAVAGSLVRELSSWCHFMFYLCSML